MDEQSAGAFLAEGADTCVHDPIVACAPGTLKGKIPSDPTNYVSRIVSVKDNEVGLQVDARATVNWIQQQNPTLNIARHFNFAVAQCTPNLAVSDLSDPRGRMCEANSYTHNRVGINPAEVNLITPKQSVDVSQSIRIGKSNKDIMSEMKPLLVAVAYLNSENVVHSDAHFNNIAWMGVDAGGKGGWLVLHDWGRTRIGLLPFRSFLDKNMKDSHDRELMHSFGQFTAPCELLDQCPYLNANALLVFMKMYDVISIVGSLAQQGLIPRARLDEIVQEAKRILNVVKPDPEESLPHVLAMVNMVFMPVTTATHPPPRPLLWPERTPTPPIANRRPRVNGSMSYNLSPGQGGGRGNKTRRFCRCIKAVKKAGKTEKGSIAICVHSVLQKKGRTLKKFKCGRKARVITQKSKLRV
jgi:hypothetical protein